jgi:hypothetical protein
MLYLVLRYRICEVNLRTSLLSGQATTSSQLRHPRLLACHSGVAFEGPGLAHPVQSGYNNDNPVLMIGMSTNPPNSHSNEPRLGAQGKMDPPTPPPSKMNLERQGRMDPPPPPPKTKK